MSSSTVSWRDLTLGIVGGDVREQEIARCAAATGATTRAFGFSWPAGGIPGVVLAASAPTALAGAGFAIFPLAGIKDGCLYAPGNATPIRIEDALLRGMAGGGHILAGSADATLRNAAAALSLSVHEFEHDEVGRMRRAPSVVEGVLGLIIANTRESIHGSTVGVLGQGIIGSLLAITLHGLGARVHAVARSPEQRAMAVAQGIIACDFGELPGIAPNLHILISTAPARIVDRALMMRLRPGALVVDLVSPPGSVDFAAAADLPITAIWGRGLGARAPVTVGRAQWEVIRRRIETILGS